VKNIFKLIVTTLLLSVGVATSAQNFYSASEYGVQAGGAQYFGDLNDNYSFATIRPMLGVFFKQHVNPFISVKASASYAHVGFNDNLSTIPFNKKRNLNFQSDIYELALMAEFNFFRYETGNADHRWTPYLVGGIGGFYYNPYTTYGGEKYYLKRLGTEGQYAGFEDRRYSNFSWCFPVGAGFKYWLGPGVNFGLEIADRLTMTDYLDDVSTPYVGADKFPTDPMNPNPAYVLQDRSVQDTEPLGRAGKQRGNSATLDQYMFIQFSLSFQMKVYRCPNYLKPIF